LSDLLLHFKDHQFHQILVRFKKRMACELTLAAAAGYWTASSAPCRRVFRTVWSFIWHHKTMSDLAIREHMYSEVAKVFSVNLQGWELWQLPKPLWARWRIKRVVAQITVV
jgi:hypothetical protein